ncbi:MAG: PQQ-dependent sugar dehydrogenase [Chloroflexota bacterium]
MFGVLLLVTSLIMACGVLPGNARARPSAQGSTISVPTGATGTLAGISVSLAPFARGLRQPVFMTHAGDGSGRVFVVERAGMIRVIQSGQILTTPFLNVRDLITTSGSEQGLLGLAFHPGYAQNGQFFIYYTANDGANTVARYYVSADPNMADPGSASLLMAIPDSRSNHNGGMLAFGPDGYLYFGTGDGGGAGDPDRNGQNSQALLGKLHRIDVNGADPGLPYAIPPSNPFAARGGSGGQVWAYGLRNPWRFSFDRFTGEMYIADVGQGDYEEIHLQPAGSSGGENYGWNIMEGAHCYPMNARCSQDGLVAPIAEYSHADGDCSVTGGYVYRGTQSPSLQGAYLFGDFCSGRVWMIRRDASGSWTAELLIDTDHQISSFGEDEAGEVYLLALSGSIFRVVAP